MVAVAHRGGLERGEVGAGIRFGIALAPPDIALKDVGQEAPLLFLAAVGHQHRRHHLHAEGHRLRGADQAHFHREDMLLGDAPAGAAVLDRPVRRGPAFLVQNFLPADDFVPAQADAGIDLVAALRRKFVLQKIPHLIPKGQIFSRKIRIHVISPKPQSPKPASQRQHPPPETTRKTTTSPTPARAIGSASRPVRVMRHGRRGIGADVYLPFTGSLWRSCGRRAASIPAPWRHRGRGRRAFWSRGRRRFG